MDYATTVEEAVKRFYATGSNDVHTWILQVQASSEAWTFVWQLLHPSKSWEVQFYAATTLHAKISKQWREVPENEYSTLQARILDSMNMPNTSKMVLAKLCQALASFLANTNISDASNKENSLVDRAMEILPYNSPQTLDLLMRVLTAVPVEFERRQGNRHTKTRDSLVRCWKKTTWLLQQIFQSYEQSDSNSNEEALYLLGLECALAWLKLGQLPLDITAQIFPHFLVAAAKYASSREDEELDSRSWEVTQECLMIAVTHGEFHRRPLLLWEWSKGLVSLARQHGGTVFCGSLTSLGEANSREFLLALTEDTDETHRWTSETLIELLLECSEHKGRYPVDETRSCIPFGFWFVLQDNVAMLDPPIDSRARNALKPIYARLAQALLRKSTLPSSPSEAGDAEARELLRCYRQDAADTLVHCYNVLDKDLLVLLGQRLSQLETEPQKWADVESTLHAFNALSAVTIEDQYVAALLDLMVSHVPYGHYPDEVLACACSAVSAYAEWIGEHPDPWLERVLQLVCHGLSVSSITSTPASMALKDISRECGPHLAPLAPSILEKIETTLGNIPPTSGEGLRLMYTAGKLLNSLTTAEQQMYHLDATLGICIRRVRELLESASQPVNTTKIEIVSRLKMIATFLSTLEGNIGKTVLDALLPIFMLIVGHPTWSRDDATLEEMLNCAQRSLQTLSNPQSEARPLLRILSTSYKTHPHTMALSTLRHVVVLFGRDPENDAASVFAEISAHTLGGFAACRSVGGDLSDLSDLLEAYLDLLAQICKKNVKLLFKVPDQIPEMLQCGMACLTVPETGTVKAAASFIHHLIMKISLMQDSSDQLKMFIEPIGQELVCVILQCVGAGYRHYYEPYAEILLALNITRWDAMRQWVPFAFADARSPNATEAQKEALSKVVLKCGRSKKMELCDALKEFSLKCQRPAVGL